MSLQFGIIDNKGNEIIKCSYDSLKILQDDLFVAKKGTNYGLIDIKNNVLIDFNYTSIYHYQEGLLLVENYDNNEYRFFDKSFTEKIKINADRCGQFSDGMAWIKKNGKFGYINLEGNIVIECQFYDCGNFDKGNAWVKNQENEFALIDNNGNIVVDYFYADDISDFREIPFKSNHAIIVSQNEDNIKQFDLLEKNASIENAQPAVFNEVSFEGVRLFDNNIAIVKQNGKWHLFNLEEAIIVGDSFDIITDDQLKYEEFVEPFNSSSLAFVANNGKFGLINIKGELIVDFKYDIFRPFKNGYACVGLKNGPTDLWCLIDESGNQICDLIYSNVSYFNESLACVCKKVGAKYKWGFIDQSGNEISEFVFLNKSIFSSSKCFIKIQNQDSEIWQIIDNNFNVFVPTEFDENYEIGAFCKGVAKINSIKTKKSGYVNIEGDLITKIEYDQFESVEFSKNYNFAIVAKSIKK